MNEDVFPIEHGGFPSSHVSFQGCMSWSSPCTKKPSKALISKAAVDGIVAREIFFVQFLRWKGWDSWSQLSLAEIWGDFIQNDGSSTSEKKHLFLVSFYSPLKYSAGFFHSRSLFLGEVTFSISNFWSCWQLGSLFISNNWLDSPPNLTKKTGQKRLGPFFASYFFLEEESKVQNRDWDQLQLSCRQWRGIGFSKKSCIVVCLRIFGLGRRSAFQTKTSVSWPKNNFPIPSLAPKFMWTKKIHWICYKGFTKLQALLGGHFVGFCW